MKAFWVSTSDASSGIYALDGSHKPVRRLALAAKALDPADWFSIRLRAFRTVIHLAVGQKDQQPTYMR